MTKFSAAMLSVLSYFLMGLYFLMGTGRLMGNEATWLILLNFGTSVIWGMSGTVWLTKSILTRQ